MTIDLGLQSVKKYKKCAAQVADELSHFPDFFLALAMFINKTYSN